MKIKIIIIIASLILATIITYLTFFIRITEHPSCYLQVYAGWPLRSSQTGVIDGGCLVAGLADITYAIFAFNMLIYFVFLFSILCLVFRHKISKLINFIFYTILIAIFTIPIGISIINIFAKINFSGFWPNWYLD